MKKKYRNTPHKTTVMTFEKLETELEIKPEPGEITSIETETETETETEVETEVETIPANGDSHIRRLEFADGRQEFHVEVFRDGEWVLQRKGDTYKEAEGVIDKIRDNRVVVNEILDY